MKILRFIGAMLLAIVLLISCGSEDDPVAPNKPTDSSITVPNGETDYFSKGMTFDTKAGENDFTFKSNSDWTISVASTRSGESWCSVSPTSGKAGRHTVKVKTEANTTYDNRQVTLTLAAGATKKTIAISQKQQDALTLTKDKFEIDAKGGTIEVEVKANISYDVIIPEGSRGWISQSTKSRGLTAFTLVFNIAESEELDKRKGEIIIKSGDLSETVHVYQSGQKILLLSKNEYEVSADGETIKVELKSNFDYAVKMPQVDWIAEDKDSRGLSSHTLYYAVQANLNHDPREAKIIFYDKESVVADTLHIVQSQKNALIIGQKEYNVKAEGDVIQLKLNRNIDYNIKIEGNWITQTSTRGLVEDVLSFTIKANETTTKRSGKIIISSKDNSITETVIVSQYGKSNNADGDADGTAPDFPWG